MSITVTVGGKVVDYVHWQDMDILDVFAPTGDTATATGYYKDGSGITLPEPGQLLQVNFSDDTGNDFILFKGPILTVSMTQDAYNTLKLEAQDLTYRLDSHYVAGLFTNSNAESMVKHILDTAAPNFTHAEIDAAILSGDTTSILPKSIDWKKPSEALQEIAEEKHYVWWVDFNGDVKFRKAEVASNPAPISTISPKTDTNIGNFQFTLDVSELKNVIYVKDFFFRSPNLEYVPGQTGFPTTGFMSIAGRIDPDITLPNRIYSIDEVTVEVSEDGGTNWETYTSRTDNLEHTAGTSYPARGAWVSPDGNRITVVRAPSTDSEANRTFPTNSVVRVKYRPQVENPIPEVVSDVESIIKTRSREKDSPANDGMHEYVISFGSLEFGGTDPVETLNDYIRSILDRYAWPTITGRFTVFWDGERNRGVLKNSKGEPWRAGQSFTLLEKTWNLFDWKHYMLTGSKDVGVTCYIKAVRTKLINPQVLRFDIEFSSVLSG